MKFKILFFILFLFLTETVSFADEFAQKSQEELKQPAYRLGTTDALEKRYSTIDASSSKVKHVYELKVDKQVPKQYSYADSNLKMLSNEISQDLTVDENKIFDDISILWDGAIRKSETIKFAIYKLSNPEADKPDDTIVKKIISPLASLTTIAGATAGDPIISTGAFLGGSLLDIFSKNEKDLNYKYTKVNDADMIVLMRKIDDLQRLIISYYSQYMIDREVLIMRQEILQKRKAQYDLVQKDNKRDDVLIADAFYREAVDNVESAKTTFLSTRAVLEQIVGFEALKKFEDSICEK